MFDNLVESTSSKGKPKRWAYFAVTAFVWVTILTTAIIIGIFRYDAVLNEQFEQLLRHRRRQGPRSHT